MYENYIKEWLLNSQARVYSVIVSTYRQKLEELKPTLFRKWLAKEIDVQEESINLSSLNSALVRQRKKESKGSNKILTVPANDKTSAAASFTFSSPENTDQRKRTTEL